MADFKIEIPITAKGNKSGEKIGKKIAEQIKKSLGSVGIGKNGGDKSIGILEKELKNIVSQIKKSTSVIDIKGFKKQKEQINKQIISQKKSAGIGTSGKTGLKTLGIIGAILSVLDALSFIITPIMALLKVIIMLLFLPLIPILKPTMKGLAAFIKFMAPLMRKVSSFVEKMYNALIGFIVALVQGISGIFKSIFTGLGEAWEVIKSGGQWIWDNIIVPAFSFLKNVGMWIWEQILLPSFLAIGDLGMKIWETLKTLFVGRIDVLTNVWNWFKGLFSGVIDVGTTILDWFKSFFSGTIDVATTVWNWFKGLFGGGGGGETTEVKDFIMRPNGQIIKTAPDDTIIGVKDPSKLGGKSITININNPIVREDIDIKKISNAVSQTLQRQMSGRISSG